MGSHPLYILSVFFIFFLFVSIVMELDASILAQRVPRRVSDTAEAASSSSTSLAEPTIAQAFEAARYFKNQLLRS